MSETEARAEFQDAPRRAGFRPEGPPIASEASAARQAARNAQRIAREASVAQRAAAMWKEAKPASTAHHYLASRQVGVHGLRRDRRNKLLVPMQDADGRIWGLQIISVDGRTMFMRDGRKHGTYAVLGELKPGAPVVIAEDFTTAATLREVTGLSAIVAFDSRNLMEVARAIRERDPERPIIFAADSERHLPRGSVPSPKNVLEKAFAAARAVQGIVLTPNFTAADTGTDWNDYAALHGKPVVRAQLEETLRMKGIELPKPQQPAQAAKPAARIATQAERDAARAKTPSTATTSAAEPSREAQQPRLRSRGPSL